MYYKSLVMQVWSLMVPDYEDEITNCIILSVSSNINSVLYDSSRVEVNT